MANRSKLPGISELVTLVNAGMTHEQIATRIAELTGQPISRSSVSAALSRAGKTNRIRYLRELPWKVRGEHARRYHPMMLRLQARLDSGQNLSAQELRRVTAWRNALTRQKAVVHYEPDTESGWWKVRRRDNIDLWWIREPGHDSDELLHT